MEKAMMEANNEKATIEKEITKIKLDSYHSYEYLKMISKCKEKIFILPNGKEVTINGK